MTTRTEPKQLRIEPGTPLLCAGCGNTVYRAPDRPALIAISCCHAGCNAYSPILVTADTLDATEPVAASAPASVYGIVVAASQGLKIPGHWENHLGPEPKTAVGRAWKALLIECGLTSMADCEQERCRRALERLKTRRRTA